LVSAPEFWFNENFGHAAGRIGIMRRAPKAAAKAGQQTTRTCDAGPGGIIRSDDPRMRDQDYQRSRR
jgi:hypothetical protein